MARIPDQTTVIVVGAGIAGLLAAKSLVENNFQVIVVDKGGRAGGRMATRVDGAAVWDTGAQFFTTRDSEFRDLVQQWEQENVASLWCRGFPEEGNPVPVDGFERYRGTAGMNAIGIHLAKDLNVRLRQTVVEVRHESDWWLVNLEGGQQLKGRGVVLTPPVPQGLQLLHQGQVSLPETDYLTLSGMDYHPCIALLVELAGPSKIPYPGALRLPGEPLYWIADNQSKGISKAVATATLHATPTYSRYRWSASDSIVIDELLKASREWIEPKQNCVHVKRWRYSQPMQTYPERCLTIAKPAGLVFAGDAFAGPRVEGAALSGLAAGRQLSAVLSTRFPPGVNS